MQSIGWLLAIVTGAVTYVMRKALVITLSGALHQIWTKPLPPDLHVERLSSLQEVQLALLTWWYNASLIEWLSLVILGAAVGVLLRVRCQRKEHPLLGSDWVLPVTAFFILWVDYPPVWILYIRQGLIAAGGFLLLLVLVFALNVVWVGLLEKLILSLDRRTPEWLA